ncbi:MAG: T9SS type A sorting domain-containing protein [Bacteroidia bacterium]
MKKTFFLILILFQTGLTFAQPWNANITTNNPTLFDFQKAFNDYWKDKTPGKGEGYSQFKRWENFWEPRVGQSGEFPPADINYTEWQKFMSKQALYKASPFKTYWSFLGPTVTPSGYNGLGRLNCVAFHPTDANIMWVGSPAGGIWKTTDFGKTWIPLSDFNLVLGVSSIAVNPNYPDSIYIATGDGDKGSLFGLTGGPQGDNKSIGILLSADGGQTWNSTGLNWNIFDVKLISKVLMNPKNSKHLVCAASDGVYLTTDAGITWIRTQTGYFMDIAFCPGNANIVYATTYDYFGNAKMYRSGNGGANFKQTFIKSLAVRITIGVTEANPAKVQLLVADKKDGKFGGIHQSIDTGNTFIIKYDTNKINILSSAHDGKTKRGQGWYDLAFSISPKDENLVFVGGVNTWKSINGSDSFKLNTMWTGSKSQNPNGIQTIHADKHLFSYNPLNGYLFDCNDGGIYYTKNNGDSWTDISEGLGITQFYKIAITESDTNIVLAGTQDNGARVRRGDKWYEVSGGDGMECIIDPKEPNIMYTSYAYGRLYRFDENGQTTISDNIKDKPKGAWVAPYTLDPNDNKIMYAGFKAIYKSLDRGNTWTPISDSIWRPNYVQHVEVSPTNSNIIYASDYYKIYKTTNGGGKWNLITTSSNPVSCIKIHPRNPDVFYYTNSNYVATSKVIRINTLVTGNDRITNLTFNLPNVAINCIEYDIQSYEGLFIGTDVGTFYKDTSMVDWEILNANMPNVVVTDLDINYKDRMLYAATFGRGAWKTNIKINPKLLVPFTTRLEPPDNSVKIQPTSQLIIYFSEPVKKGTGSIGIFENASETQKINVNSDSVVIDGNRILVTPGEFGLGKAVNVTFPKGTFLDTDNNEHKGLMTNTEWNFTITSDLSVTNLNLDKVVKIFPNPSKGQIYIKAQPNLEIKNIKVYNALGKLLFEKSNSTPDCCEFNLGHFSKGLYFILIATDKGFIGERFVKE